ncbi:MAG: glycoside hydrolase family 6 protein [Actinomycetota bacterium]|nr:glycoside hydrolase family 6 protein [Actinomycetota bacterium]
MRSANRLGPGPAIPHSALRLAVAMLLAASVLLSLDVQAQAAGSGMSGRASGSSTPLLGGTWGHYTGQSDPAYIAWESATGTNKTLLAKIGLRSKVQWFGSWIPTSQIGDKIHRYISRSQHGDPRALVQLAIFRLWPKGEKAKAQPLTLADQAAYRGWVDTVARAIGSTRVAMVLEPDLAVALHGWRPSVRLSLARYAARAFGALPRTSVYLDASDADWLKVTPAVSMLRSAGVRFVRGFALGATHYAATSSEVTFGREIISALTKAGISGRHFVIDTADNGRPFTWKQYYAAHPNGNFDNAEVCQSRTQLRCDTLGIPPTTHVSDPSQVDAYLWFGRPWLVNQASPFSLSRALAVARTTPY